MIVKERDDIEEKITLQYEAGDGGSIAAVDAATGKYLKTEQRSNRMQKFSLRRLQIPVIL